MAIKGTITSTPARNEKTNQNDILNGVEKQLAELTKRIDDGTKPPSFLRALGGGLINKPMGSDLPMNEADLKDSLEFNNAIAKESTSTQTIKELINRLAELEDRLPEFKGLNSWDVIIPPLKSTASLEDVIKTLNTLIQRNQRQIRIK